MLHLNLRKQPIMLTSRPLQNIYMGSTSATTTEQEDLPQVIPITSKKADQPVNFFDHATILPKKV